MSETAQQSFYQIKGELSVEEICQLKEEWKRQVTKPSQFLGQKVGEGKGIVISAGGLRYFTSAWVLINTLRNFGCNLPIEIWFHGNEISRGMKRQLAKLGVQCKDLRQFMDNAPHGFLMKPLSILYSSFQEVLFLDADNNCVKDPTYLFENAAYKKHGCMFWPDYWQTSVTNPIWEILEIEYSKSYEQDSGQILIDKAKSWNQLQLCAYFNMRRDVYYKFLYGDKDTFRFAWLALGTPYYMIEHAAGTCGYKDNRDNSFNGTTMVQHDTDNEIIFLHRNLLKWDITLKDESIWQTIKVFTKNAKEKKHYFKRSMNKHHAIDIGGEIEEKSFDAVFPGFEQECLNILNKLRVSRFYKNELLNYYFHVNRFS
ncbi:hypothetical protein SNE26_07305 [Mucilaginibacter sp. cycad4]|uniref:hypothetical protein n=1 Tax=Mucilaginibacter sp. cycad4 TaxID=3342096 RepID=UPI002AAADA81|nr:hypothetical protein [Mucilaginibacter gossypii]WPV01579.1 hypothetical protein SNE26_07305 [Mucilaginibacter gossypii]